MWGKQTQTEMKQYFDRDHQLMYTYGHAGTLQKLIIYPRDSCYVRTRLALNGVYNGRSYDVISSMNYSVDEKHPFYVKVPKNYVRADINYRGFALIETKDSHSMECIKTKLVYVSSFDFHGQIPRLIIEKNLKNKGLEVIREFDETWNDKMKILEKRKMPKDEKPLEMPKNDALFQQNMFKSWLTDVGLPQYYQIFVDNGFENVSYLKNDVTIEHLEKIGITKLGHCLKIIAEIKKLDI